MQVWERSWIKCQQGGSPLPAIRKSNRRFRAPAILHLAVRSMQSATDGCFENCPAPLFFSQKLCRYVSCSSTSIRAAILWFVAGTRLHTPTTHTKIPRPSTHTSSAAFGFLTGPCDLPPFSSLQRINYHEGSR